MTISMKAGIILATSLFCTFAASGSVWARTIMNGAACHYYNAGEANDIDYYVDGVRSLAANDRYIICPLTVSHASSKGYVVINTDAAQPIDCSLHSYSENNQLLGSSSITIPAGVNSAKTATVPTSAHSTASVLCDMPSGGYNKLVSIEVNF
jgi:hypothetical protein